MKKLTLSKLENRHEIVAAASKMVRGAKPGGSVYIAGRSASWFRDPKFREAVESLKKKKPKPAVTFWLTTPRLIPGQVKAILAKLKEDGVVDSIFKKRIGHLRVCLVDGEKVLLAHSAEYAVSDDAQSVYGVFFKDPDFGQWLFERFRFHNDEEKELFPRGEKNDDLF